MKMQEHVNRLRKSVSHRGFFCFLLAALAAPVGVANAQSLAFVSKNYDARSNSYSVRTADFNGDGKTDLVVANYSNRVSVFIGNGDGSFMPPTRVYANYDLYSTAVLVADLNGDGKLDLGVNALNSFYVVPGRGDGTFGFATYGAETNAGDFVVVGDFNGDGKVDLAGTSSSWDWVQIAFGNGNGTFREQPQITYRVDGNHGLSDQGSTPLVVGDFNHDGKLDLATANVIPARPGQFANDVSVLLGNGNGTFQPMVNYAAGTGPSSLFVVDLNGDGHSDFAVTNSDSNMVSVLLGNGDGTFHSTGNYAAGKSPRAMAAADFDSDGTLDLAATNWECLGCGGRFSILPGNGDGTFRRPVSVTASTKSNAQSIAASDFDGDGRPDIAVGNTGYLSVLRNSPVVTANPLDTAEFFTRQHYYDFLQRDADQGGLAYWTAQINDCNGEPTCIHERRITVSAAFFVEQEYQEISSFIYRLYRAAFDRKPNFQEFTHDRWIFDGGLGVYDLQTRKQDFANWWIDRLEFRTLYPSSFSNTTFVYQLFNRAGLTPYVAERQFYIDALNSGATRGYVLRSIIDDPPFKQREYNSSFVLAQYFGYLRRDPDQAGYDFWLNVLNSQPNNYRGMVCSFITSTEYQLKFSPVATHSNAECGP